MSRRLAAIALVLVAAIAVYFFFVRDRTVTANVRVAQPAATLTAGGDVAVISGSGRAIPWYPLREDLELPSLPEAELPPNGRLAGPMLEQAKVLGATPRQLRPYVERSVYGSSGVDVLLDSGIELRFGDSTQAARKWRAAAAVLADPTIFALDYVDLLSPGHPATGGSGHVLPPPP